MANQDQIFTLNAAPLNISSSTITVDRFWNQLKRNTCEPAKVYFIISLIAAAISGIIGKRSVAGIIFQICIISCLTLIIMGLCQIPFAGKTLAWMITTCLVGMLVSGVINTVICGDKKSKEDDVVYIEE